MEHRKPWFVPLRLGLRFFLQILPLSPTVDLPLHSYLFIVRDICAYIYTFTYTYHTYIILTHTYHTYHIYIHIIHIIYTYHILYTYHIYISYIYHTCAHIPPWHVLSMDRPNCWSMMVYAGGFSQVDASTFRPRSCCRFVSNGAGRGGTGPVESEATESADPEAVSSKMAIEHQ